VRSGGTPRCTSAQLRTGEQLSTNRNIASIAHAGHFARAKTRQSFLRAASLTLLIHPDAFVADVDVHETAANPEGGAAAADLEVQTSELPTATFAPASQITKKRNEPECAVDGKNSHSPVRLHFIRRPSIDVLTTSISRASLQQTKY